LTQALIASLLIVAGFLVSYYFGDIKENNEKIKKIIKRKK